MWKRPWEWSYQRRSEMVANHPYLEAEYRVSAPGPAAQIFSIKAVGIGDETKAARDHRRKPVSDSVR